MYDIITIGSATHDIAINSEFANLTTTKTKDSEATHMCFDYGAKIEIDDYISEIGGGAVNSAVNFSNLGFKTAIIAKIGDDVHGKAIIERLEEKNVAKDYVKPTIKSNTGVSVILTSFEGDRTVLTHRGANTQITRDDIPFHEIKNAKWLYIAPLSNASNNVLDEIAAFAETNGISMAINPGTTQLAGGLFRLKKVFCTAEVLIMNKVEASKITHIEMLPDKKTIEYSIPEDIREMLKKLYSLKPKLAVITNGGHGAYAIHEDTIYYVPNYPSKVISTVGAGDAFASTLVAALQETNWNIDYSLKAAAINASGVVASSGAHHGLRNFDEIKAIIEEDTAYNIIPLS